MKKLSFIPVLALVLAGAPGAAAQDPQPLPAGPAAGEGTRTLSKGTEIKVKTQDQISSLTSKAGDIVAAAVEDNVKDATGAVLFPSGAKAQLVVVNTPEGLGLQLQSVESSGRTFTIKSAWNTTPSAPRAIDAGKPPWNIFQDNEVGRGKVSGIKQPPVGADLVIPPGTSVEFDFGDEVVTVTS